MLYLSSRLVRFSHPTRYVAPFGVRPFIAAFPLSTLSPGNSPPAISHAAKPFRPTESPADLSDCFAMPCGHAE